MTTYPSDKQSERDFVDTLLASEIPQFQKALITPHTALSTRVGNLASAVISLTFLPRFTTYYSELCLYRSLDLDDLFSRCRHKFTEAETEESNRLIPLFLFHYTFNPGYAAGCAEEPPPSIFKTFHWAVLDYEIRWPAAPRSIQALVLSRLSHFEKEFS